MMNIWVEGEHIYKYFQKKDSYILEFFGTKMGFWDKHGYLGQKYGGLA